MLDRRYSDQVIMDTIQTLLDLPKMVLPYALRPLTAIEVFLPHTRLFSWLVQQNDFQPKRDIPSLEGKVILITGGNAGLGLETVYQLAVHQPAKIYLAARSESKAHDAILQIKNRLQEDGIRFPTIEWLGLDLTDLKSVKQAAEEVLNSENRLDILVLNAGIMATPPSKTASGHDLQLGTNHLGHFYLTKLLLPLLEKTAETSLHSDTSVITVSSEAHHLAGSGFLDLIENHGKLCSASDYTRYGVSKAANILFAAELARRVNPKKITSVSLHPGVIMTNLYSSSKASNPFVRYGLPPVAQLMFDDVEHGALNTLWCIAKSGTSGIENGGYYTPVGKFRNSELTRDKKSAARLWSWSEDQITHLV